jgi:MFS transporter, MHS family, proline/betaine transporter
MQHTKNTIWDILNYLKTEKELYRAVKLLSLGSFLEWFDLFLYAHMAIVLNGLFFPIGDAHAQSLLSAFAFCSSFIFRPIGALLFGYIGDVYGRKVTVVITTLLMAVTCLIMANAPTYEQVGIAAAWIVTFCRILQGMTSMGEVTAAQMFLTEATPEPAMFPVVGLINISTISGALAAVAVGALATSTGFDWRIAFWVGAGIAVVGSFARTHLRESIEYADARKRIESVARRAGEKLGDLTKQNFYKTKIPTKPVFAYLGIMLSSQVFLYFVYFYSPTILRNNFQYTVHQVLVHNLFLGIIELIGVSLLRTYLTTITHPLKILRYNWIALFIFSLFIPWLLGHITAVWHLFAIQVFVILCRVYDFPATPIFYKSFPVFKRFTAASLIYSTAYAFSYVVTAFGLIYLINYLGYWGLLVLTVPTLIAYGYGLNYFIQQETKIGRYPVIDTWPIRESIRKEGDEIGWVKVTNRK